METNWNINKKEDQGPHYTSKNSKEQEATSSLYSGLQKYSEWCMVNLALKKRTERSLSFSHRPYIAILMMFDCVCSEYPDPDYLHYRW